MNQNKGIGAYKDRPGYFMGGMIGGAILGALVNKIQGKDWKRGALWGGITGGVTGGMTGQGGLAGWLGKTGGKGAAWLAKDPGLFKTTLAKSLPFIQKNPWVTGAIGAGGAYMMGDPAYDRRKQEEYMNWIEEKRRKANLDQYAGWYDDPWENWNKGGVINARPKYYNGGGAWSDVAGEEEILGSGQDKIMSITGQEGIESLGGLEDISETFDVSETGSGIEAYHKLLADKYRPWLEDMDIDTTGMEDFEVIEIYSDLASKYAHSAEGGYKKKAKGGIEDLDLTQGGSSFGPGTGTSDDIPAMLSDGEFVVTANAVKNLGGGDRMLGARKMYQMMNQLDPASQTPAEMNTVGMT